MQEYTVVFDLAKRRDFTAGLVVRKTPELIPGNAALRGPDRIVNFLDILHIDKFNGLTYPQMVARIADRVGHADLQGVCDLVVDGTGIGEAVVDLLRDKGLEPIPILFTGGTNVKTVYWDFAQRFAGTTDSLLASKVLKELHVPQPDLVDAGKLLAQQGRVRCDPSLRWADELAEQMAGFRGKVNEKGRVRYEAATEDIHDDLIVCYLMAAWWMQQDHENEVRERVIEGSSLERDWSPFDYM